MKKHQLGGGKIFTAFQLGSGVALRVKKRGIEQGNRLCPGCDSIKLRRKLVKERLVHLPGALSMSIEVDMMPIKPSKVCCYPGCQWLAERQGYCERHKGSGWQRNKTHQSMYDHRWERESKVFLTENPWCHDCGGPATEVHHVKKHEGDPVLFWNRSNWMPICHRCHSKRTRRGE